MASTRHNVVKSQRLVEGKKTNCTVAKELVKLLAHNEDVQYIISFTIADHIGPQIRSLISSCKIWTRIL